MYFMIKRSEVKPEYKWKIEDMFATDSAWDKEKAAVTEAIRAFSANDRVTLDNLYEILQSRDDILRRVDYLYVYAGLRSNEDSTNSLYQAMADKSEGLITEFSSATAFLEPAILALDETELRRKLTSAPLSLYKHYIEDILRNRAHILSRDKEELLAQLYEVGNAPSNIFYMLDNADMTFPEIEDSNGNKHQLSHGSYISYLESRDRVLRQNAFNTYYDTYLKQKNTLAAVYAASVKKDVAFSKVRGYGSSLESMLFAGNIPTEVYTSLIATVEKHLPLLHRYVRLRKKMLGLDELHFYDLYTPIVQNTDTKRSYSEAKTEVLKATAVLGKAYTDTLTAALENDGWVDIYENEGKRSGAYSWGAYGCHPFVSLNYNNTVDSMFTLAHEMGHAMHSHYTWDNQPVVYGDYTIFVAEVASTVNEALLMEHLLKTTEDPHFKAYLLNYFMEQFRGTLFRQTMFAEFELETHKIVEEGGALTFDGLNELYMELNKKYFGDEIVYDDKIACEWARIPHFYTAFYVYQYATGYSAAIALSQNILNNNGAEKYLDFLKGGSSKYSIDLLKGAGVDMTSPQPIEKALKVFEGLLTEMEKTVK
jgi:oligoendopeptidase F